MWCVLWLSWKPLKLLLLVKGPHNWVLLLYYTLWFLHTLTSKPSPHLTKQVSAFLMGSKPFKHTAKLVRVSQEGRGQRNTGIQSLNVNLKVNETVFPFLRAYDTFFYTSTEKQPFSFISLIKLG